LPKWRDDENNRTASDKPAMLVPQSRTGEARERVSFGL
jgi:hypothetical protein